MRRVIVQIESLRWITNTSEVDLLVLDEIESILSHVASIYKSDIILGSL